MKMILTQSKSFISSIALILICGFSALAQTNIVIYKAELSVPFGEAEGRVLAVGEQLVFIDNDKSEFSFAIEKSNVSNVSRDDKILTIETKREVKDRSGVQTRFVMRIFVGGADKLEKWLKFGLSENFSGNTGIRSSNVSMKSGMIYEAKHAHRLYGSCTGHLIIAVDRVTYESSDDREHSRQWLFTDIKKLKRNSPYKFEVKLFKGSGYELGILGNGIDITDFKEIENMMAMANANR